MYEVILSNRSSGVVKRKQFPSRDDANKYVEQKRESVGERKNVTFRNYYVEVRRVS